MRAAHLAPLGAPVPLAAAGQPRPPCTGGAADSCGRVAQAAGDHTRVSAAYRG